MAKRKTTLLSLLLVAGVFAMVLAYFHLSAVSEAAAIAQANLLNGRQTIREIHDWKASPGRAAAVSADNTELNQRLRQAATAAALADAPGTDTGTVKPIGNTDYSEMAIFLRFEPLTIRELTTFLHALAETDPSLRATQIELSPPEDAASAGAKAPGEERWRADVAVGYLTYTPRRGGGR